MKKSGYEQFFAEVRKRRTRPEPGSKTPDFKPRKPKRTTKSRTPRVVLAMILFSCLGLGTSVAIFYDPNSISFIWNSVDIHLFGQARADDTSAKSSPTSVDKPATIASPAANSSATDDAGASRLTPEEIKIFSKLNERKHQLDLRAQKLDKLEAELQQQQVKLDAKIQKLEDLRNQIAQTLQGRVNEDQKKIDQLVAFYSNMKPEQAAKIIGALDEDLAVETLTHMKQKNAAKIMDLLDPKKAESLSEKIAGFKR